MSRVWRLMTSLRTAAVLLVAQAVLLLHQTPRSWAEYRAVLPILGTRYRAIAMDTIKKGLDRIEEALKTLK